MGLHFIFMCASIICVCFRIQFILSTRSRPLLNFYNFDPISELIFNFWFALHKNAAKYTSCNTRYASCVYHVYVCSCPDQASSVLGFHVKMHFMPHTSILIPMLFFRYVPVPTFCSLPRKRVSFLNILFIFIFCF